ncbi:Core-2/I-branching beta-1,6-N-acetylglucosaminyltransferase family protein [Quillaja saponaria]|uniref:Core-2/I-branching beta-1,6-N-acetylglucosaminyltransferase family protein n=1 Tax=Quillaja saponaria TaxID=32244 RepID=A0AAD7Q5A7_QUISA|nr:Core-2/I-branching beta-1,6-N-acetylglucosaminyltransferase family protein [Quillaja saponaria]
MKKKQSQHEKENPTQASNLKFFKVQLHLHNLVARLLLFASGLAIGITITSHFKEFPLDQYLPIPSIKFTPSESSFSSSLSVSPPPPSIQIPSCNISSNQSKKMTRIGFKQHFKVQPAMHDMTEEELLWKASMVPKIADYPFNFTPKVAFLFLTKGLFYWLHCGRSSLKEIKASTLSMSIPIHHSMKQYLKTLFFMATGFQARPVYYSIFRFPPLYKFVPF